MKPDSSIRSLLFALAIVLAVPLVILLAYSFYNTVGLGPGQLAQMSNDTAIDALFLLAGILLVAWLASRFSNRIERPINALVQATTAVTAGIYRHEWQFRVLRNWHSWRRNLMKW
jgi:HAMP domain-containing protein